MALAFRNLPPGIKITALRNQLGFKYSFVAPRTCGGGSPRVTLLVDSDGDGETDFAAHGHPNPFLGCPPNVWKYKDLTDDGSRWEVTPAFFVDDSCSFFPASCGKAHYDLLTIENRTLETHHDTVKQ